MRPHTRPTVDACRYAEIRPVRRIAHGLEVEARWYFPKGVEVDWTPCHYGGARPWLVCRGCGMRRLVLYRLQSRVRCRVCAGLAYVTQSVARFRRLQIRRQRISRRLGGDGKPCGEFPDKPPGMHWRTFQRYGGLFERLEDEELDDLWVAVGKLAARLGSCQRRD